MDRYCLLQQGLSLTEVHVTFAFCKSLHLFSRLTFADHRNTEMVLHHKAVAQNYRILILVLGPENKIEKMKVKYTCFEILYTYSNSACNEKQKWHSHAPLQIIHWHWSLSLYNSHDVTQLQISVVGINEGLTLSLTVHILSLTVHIPIYQILK